MYKPDLFVDSELNHGSVLQLQQQNLINNKFHDLNISIGTITTSRILSKPTNPQREERRKPTAQPTTWASCGQSSGVAATEVYYEVIRISEYDGADSLQVVVWSSTSTASVGHRFDSV